jgi:hypothetical protein
MRMSVIEWLLDSDPSIRWQVMRDLIGESDATVARERSRVAAEGWGARLLDLQGADGHWGGAAFVPHAWISTKDTLQLLRDLGVDPTSDRVRRAIGQVRDRCTWGEEFGDSPFFEGEVEPCINGRVLAIGAYFGEARDRLAGRLIQEQLSDGGWNCDAPRRPRRRAEPLEHASSASRVALGRYRCVEVRRLVMSRCLVGTTRSKSLTSAQRSNVPRPGQALRELALADSRSNIAGFRLLDVRRIFVAA